MVKKLAFPISLLLALLVVASYSQQKPKIKVFINKADNAHFEIPHRALSLEDVKTLTSISRADVSEKCAIDHSSIRDTWETKAVCVKKALTLNEREVISKVFEKYTTEKLNMLK